MEKRKSMRSSAGRAGISGNKASRIPKFPKNALTEEGLHVR
jgi:hypothetical protein